MKKDKTAIHPSGQKIYFDEEKHIYWMDDGTTFTSATKWLDSFFNEFNMEEVASRYARKHMIDIREVKAMWTRKGQLARDYGTAMHEYAEFVLTEQQNKIKNPTAKYVLSEISQEAMRSTQSMNKILKEQKDFIRKEINTRRYVDMCIQNMLKDYEFVESEKIIFSPEYKISGTIDLLLYHKKLKTYAICDWKTNEKIRFDNPWQSGKGCINHLEDCNANHYYLQLNLYKQILLNEKYYDANIELFIIHIGPLFYNWYAVPDMTTEIHAMIKEKNELNTL